MTREHREKRKKEKDLRPPNSQTSCRPTGFKGLWREEAPRSTGFCCQQCGASLTGKRSDSKFCGVNCRNTHFKRRVGRTETIAAVVVIDKATREVLIEAGDLNMQDEHSPAKVREAFERAWQSFLDQYA
ncbi:hypothetical protein EOA13_31395 [Mesorhizobium sp. M7A.F.Ca.US.011.01.1.1]|uniref:hypothetical protein n=1 Tax=Mesorhizobium sp. M7A.F.Ca.US.011.01.1.1 TaxID=2496741 RepID=UPI000FCA40BD|nr:hypothetical protein [Mesorhizobium sp. M7A.F.Ca.US.011.01.1.1]RUX24200.1 hypothetical protein EOA13_31395 [Mesorhizobium sp. M7A.F.Ca.US.011.01.1.1]